MLASQCVLAAVAADVVEIHRAGQVEVAVGVEAADQRVAVVVEVALDVEGGAERGVEHGPGGRVATEAQRPCSPGCGR